MNAEKLQTVNIAYPKHWFLIGTLVYSVVTVLLFYLSSSSADDFPRNFWLAMGLLVGIPGFLFIVPPLFTSHLAGSKVLKLKMGFLASYDVPYEWIKEVKQMSIPWGGVRVGIGVRYSPIPRILFVTSSFSDLVRLELDSDHPIGRIWKRPVAEIVLSVSNMTGMMDIVRERAKFSDDEE